MRVKKPFSTRVALSWNKVFRKNNQKKTFCSKKNIYIFNLLTHLINMTQQQNTQMLTTTTTMTTTVDSDSWTTVMVALPIDSRADKSKSSWSFGFWFNKDIWKKEVLWIVYIKPYRLWCPNTHPPMDERMPMTTKGLQNSPTMKNRSWLVFFVAVSAGLKFGTAVEEGGGSGRWLLSGMRRTETTGGG